MALHVAILPELVQAPHMCMLAACGGLCREAEYSRATAELIKEAGQVRAESGRVKGQLEACQRDLEEARSQLREKEELAESSAGSMSQELAARAQQVCTGVLLFVHVISCSDDRC